MRGPGTRARLAIVLFATALLAGCATLPAEEAVAFRKLASAKSDAFLKLGDAEAAAISGLAQDNIAKGGGGFQANNCTVDQTGACVLTYTNGAAHYPITVAAPKARAIAKGLAEYGEQMAGLAEATDLEEAKAKTAGVGASIKSLASVVGAPPLVGAVVDLGIWARQQDLVTQRRKALLAAAEKAHPVIEKAAVGLGDISKVLKDNLETVSSARLKAALTQGQDLREAQQRLEADIAVPKRPVLERVALEEQLDGLRTRRAASAKAAVEAAAGLNAARSVSTDYSSLTKAHEKLLARLRDPKVSLEDALTDLNTFLGLLDAIEEGANA